MRKLRMLMMMGCIPMILGAEEYKEPEKINLNKGWEFSQVGKSEWLPAKVPGTVHQDLINHGMIPNPFYGKNEEKVQWVENEDWTYRTTFNVTDEQLAREAAVLEFEGLDTYADIYLNGSLLERTDNMFVGYTLPVKEVLRKWETVCRFISIHPSNRHYRNGKQTDLTIRQTMTIVTSVSASIPVKHLTVMDGIGAFG